VLSGFNDDSYTPARQLQDLRSGEVLGEWGPAFEDGGRDATGDFVLGTGFADGRSLLVEFETTVTMADEAYAERAAGPLSIHVLGPDGEDRELSGGSWGVGTPRVALAGPDGRTAVLYTAGYPHVLVVDLDAAEVRAVTLDQDPELSCQAAAPGYDGTVVAACVTDESWFLQTYDGRTGVVLDSTEQTGSIIELAGFVQDYVTLTDTVTGTVVDTSRASDVVASGAEVIPVSEGVFAIRSRWMGPGVVLYSRRTGESFTISGDFVPGTRRAAATISVVPLLGFTPDQSGLIFGADA
jgi:hypothetical protein